MTTAIGRREFIVTLGGAASAASISWPLPLSAQQPSASVIGYLTTYRADTNPKVTLSFHQGLGDTGYVEGRNLKIEYRRMAEYAQLPARAAELVRLNVALIVASGPAAAALAAKAATTTIPIVFICGEDPVKSGLVESLSRPGGNVTGLSFYTSPLEQKRMELLHELLPTATRIGVLINPTFLEAKMQADDARAAAGALGQQIIVANARSDREIEQALSSLVDQRAEGLLVASDPFFFTRRDHIAATAARKSMPAIYNVREYVEAGGLLSYGTNIAEIYRQAGSYIGRILRGTKPADLPVMLPSKFELVVNLKAVRALGLDVPTSILLRADEVIE